MTYYGARELAESFRTVRKNTVAVAEDIPEEKYSLKAEVIALLKTEGEKWGDFVAGLSDDFLGQTITMPPGGTPPSRTRFDMILGAKEHEMHHRAQLMLIE